MAHEIRAEMSASVWKVEVAKGETVSAGQTVVILESMKMEIPVSSPTSGTVTAVHVEPNAVVQEGDVLATIE